MLPTIVFFWALLGSISVVVDSATMIIYGDNELSKNFYWIYIPVVIMTCLLWAFLFYLLH